MSQISLEQELASRHARLRGELDKIGASALVVTRPSAVTYLTGYTTATWSNFSRPVIGNANS